MTISLRRIMKDRRWPNLALVGFSLFVILSIWQTFPHLAVIHEYAIIPVYTLNAANFTPFYYPTHFLSPSDYEQLITLRDFRYSMLNDVCSNSAPFVLVLVHTAPKNAHKRQTIRETWGQERKDIKVVFLLGNVTTNEVQNELEEENDQYRDLVQGNFLDAYRNMTYKHVMAFKYAIYHCPKAKYILKTDDDIFVNMPSLIDFLKEELSPYGAERLLLCMYLQYPSRAKRSYRSKWRVSFREYPYRYYPPYCLGWVIMYSPDVLFTLYLESQNAEYFWIDDVLITGMLAQKAKIAPTPVNHLILSRSDLNTILSNTCRNLSKAFLFGTPNMSEKEIRTLWGCVQYQNGSTSFGFRTSS